MPFFVTLNCYICINITEIMTYEEALTILNQALSAATKAGVYTLKDSENIIQSLYKINEAIKVATEVSLQQTGENSFVGGQVVDNSEPI
jgi:hypothetical protein